MWHPANDRFWPYCDTSFNEPKQPSNVPEQPAPFGGGIRVHGNGWFEKTNGEGLPSPRRSKFDSASSSPHGHAFIKSTTRIVAGVLPLLAVISIVPTLHVHM